MTTKDHLAEYIYESTTINTERYTVRLPFVQDGNIGNSDPMGLIRLKSIEEKFKSNDDLKKNYIVFMKECLLLSHVQRVFKNDLNLPTEHVYYLPHHAVL